MKEREANSMLTKEVEELRVKVDRYESRIGTHSPDCYLFGYRHYDCALRKIEELQKIIEVNK